MVSLLNIEGKDAYLMTSDDKKLQVYNHSTKETKSIDFGPDGQDYVD